MSTKNQTLSVAERVGKSRLCHGEIAISKICFGTSALASWPEVYGYSIEEKQARATLRAIFDGPTNFLDTAPIYGDGRAEERIGEVIRERGGLPAGFVISTKLDRDFTTNRFDGAVARKSLEKSLKTLGLDRVPLLFLHDPEYATSLDDVRAGAIPELFKMKNEGFVDYVGLGGGRVDVLMPMLREWNFDVLLTHNRFNLINRNAEAMIDFARSKGMTVLNAAPYGSGVLAKGTANSRRFAYHDADDEVLAHVKRVEGICANYEVPLGAAALQFSMRDPRISSTVVGVTKPDRVQQTLDWALYPIPDVLWTELAGLTPDTNDPEGVSEVNRQA